MTDHTPLTRLLFPFNLREHHGVTTSVWTIKAIFKWPVTAAINYNCEFLLRTVMKLCSVSLPPFIPIMVAPVIKR